MSANLTEISSVSLWNQSLRAATASGRTVVVDFWATWCGPCKAIAPTFDKLAEQYPQVHFLRVDVDAQQAIAAKYKITAMPTFIAIKAGKPVDQLRGADPNGLQNLVKRHAGPNPPIPPLPEKAEEAKAAGNEHFKKGEYKEAIAKYTEALDQVPTSAQLYANRSISHLKLTPPDHAAALSDARKATVLDAGWAKGWIRLGDAYVACGEKGEAKGAYERAVGLLSREQGNATMKKEAEDKLKALA
ncbi:hypothetical protein AX16_007077 [Volvariella volvacea WC 439]|nr:hypothetical protein AX16_007077 [Volvariella volvacea WC 439]